jgi:hypothetical protein
MKLKPFFLLFFVKYTLFAQPTDYVPANHKPLLGDIHFGNRVGGEIAQEGMTKQLICLEEGSELHTIQVNVTNAKNVVKGFAIEVFDKSKTKKIFVFGDTSGVWQEKIIVKKGVQLVGFSGTVGWFIDSIRFHFSDGSKSKRFGGNGGDIAFEQILNKDKKGRYKGRWMGFWGSATDQLETLSLIFFPIE